MWSTRRPYCFKLLRAFIKRQLSLFGACNFSARQIDGQVVDSHGIVRFTNGDIRVYAEIGPRQQDLIKPFLPFKRVDVQPYPCCLGTQFCASFAVDPQIAGEAIDRALVSACPLQEKAQAADRVFDHRAHRTRKIGGHPLVLVTHDRRVHGVVDDRCDRVALGIVNSDHIDVVVDEAVPVPARE